MEIALPYGRQELALRTEGLGEVRVVNPNPRPPLPDAQEAVRRALEEPIASPPLRSLLTSRDRVAIVVSDVTRLWVGTHLMLPPILEEVAAAGIPEERVSIVVALGDHRRQTPEEHALICGAEVVKRYRVEDHDCFSPDLVDYGTSSFGTPLAINRTVATADKLILTGGVSYHILAGFGGGRKSVLPGVAGYEGIQKNHSLALEDPGPDGVNPRVGPGLLEGNPVSEDMLEAARKVGTTFIVNAVVDDAKNYLFVAAGELDAAHRAACRVFDEVFGVAVEGEADLVLASCGGYPKDTQLYQAIKALDNAARAVRPGGVIVLVAACSEGVGSQPFFEFFRHRTLAAMSAALREHFLMPGFVAFRTASICQRAHVILVSSLAKEVVRETGMLPAADLGEALEMARAILGGAPALTYVLPHGGATFPKFAAK